jgi:hypothetical protein
MIRLIPNPTFRARVKFTQPGGEDAFVDFVFRHKSPTALSAWLEASKDKSIASAMADVIESWSGVIDEAGSEVAFDADALAAFCAGHGPRAQELLGTYLRELTESRRKN